MGYRLESFGVWCVNVRLSTSSCALPVELVVNHIVVACLRCPQWDVSMVRFTATYRYMDIKIIAHNLLCPLHLVSGSVFERRGRDVPALPCGPMLILEITRYHISRSVTCFVSNGVL